MPSRQDQKAREVRQLVWVKRTTIPDGAGGQIEVSCLIASEEDASQGVKPVEWQLRTNRVIDSSEAAIEAIDWYRTW